MPAFGGMSPFPIRFGGGKTRTQVILSALNADRGTAFDTADRTTTVYVENMAIARAIAAGWGTNVRLGNIRKPSAMTDTILGRWETILGILPAPTDSEAVRRNRVATLFARTGQAAINGFLTTLLSNALGAAFVAIEHVDYSNAVILVPDGTYPWGSVGSVPWSSTVAHILVRLQKPAGWAESDFYSAAANVATILESALPVWVTFDWYRPGPTSVAVTGGPSAGGFYLDDSHNLDNEVFDV